jgi:hypothetical protein
MTKIEYLQEQKKKIDQAIRQQKILEVVRVRKERVKAFIEIAAWLFSKEMQERHHANWRYVHELLQADKELDAIRELGRILSAEHKRRQAGHHPELQSEGPTTHRPAADVSSGKT